MKINILYKIKEAAWGGGNTFLNALKKELLEKGVYEDVPAKADIILFNSFPFGDEYLFKEVEKLKNLGKTVIHRVDGPIFKIRGKDIEVDKIIYMFNDFFADGTIFQSNWSRQENCKLGMKKSDFEIVITNASNPDIFNRKDKTAFLGDGKIKLISSSWSSNIRKGFEIYKYIDDNLDFSKYEMDFIGNSPIIFKNIKNKGAINGSVNLAKELKKYDIFITASEKDPCSNSLIEALSCGLPAIALNDGGHPEIVKEGGALFNNKEEILNKIEEVVNNYDSFQSKIKLQSMDETVDKYYAFMKKVYLAKKEENKFKKKKNGFNFLKIFLAVYIWKLKNKIRKIFK